jgi:spermidine/putrescine transport system ATP-binding protein
VTPHAAVADPPAVEVRRLSKSFVDRRGHEVRAVDDVTLSIGEGEFFAMLGPSGCGKTTTLRAIAGFETPTSGDVLLRGRSVVAVPPYRRSVNTVFQDYALFPHMSVRDNVMFGLRMARVPEREARSRAEEALALVHLPDVAARRPAQLSGGQRQRVALARALVNRPAVLLLDEPLGALDLKLRKAMQTELKALQRSVGITFVYVTHDQEEALAMADRMAVMAGGRALQVGSPREVYERPASRFVADFIGEANAIEGVLVRRTGDVAEVRTPAGVTILGVVRAEALQVGASVACIVRPEVVWVDPREVGGGDGWNRCEGAIADLQYLGTDTRITVVLDAGGSLFARVPHRDAHHSAPLALGRRVRLVWRVADTGILP